MKKYILAPLCSAFVVPGLGQIINQSLKKGIIILAAVFVLIIAGAVKFVLMVNALFQTRNMQALGHPNILREIPGHDFHVLWMIVALFIIIWIYSIADAFLVGLKLETSQEKGDP
jgi:archaellum biogenesis protein FlaJ (TadC family)